MQSDENKTLKLRIERSEKTTEKDVSEFYIRVYKMAENLGFNVIAPQENNYKIALKGDNQNENTNNI